MTQEVQLGKESVILDTEMTYSGAENPGDEEKLVRKAVGLPVKKQLVYYKDKRSSDSVVSVTSYQFIKMIDITEKWYVIEVMLVDGTKARIHSNYLAEMQKPSFIADIAAQMA